MLLSSSRLSSSSSSGDTERDFKVSQKKESLHIAFYQKKKEMHLCTVYGHHIYTSFICNILSVLFVVTLTRDFSNLMRSLKPFAIER